MQNNVIVLSFDKQLKVDIFKCACKTLASDFLHNPPDKFYIMAVVDTELKNVAELIWPNKLKDSKNSLTNEMCNNL